MLRKVLGFWPVFGACFGIPTSQGTLNTASIRMAPPNRQIPALNTAHITWNTGIRMDILPLPG